jgi:hypothetical protein
MKWLHLSPQLPSWTVGDDMNVMQEFIQAKEYVHAIEKPNDSGAKRSIASIIKEQAGKKKRKQYESLSWGQWYAIL